MTSQAVMKRYINALAKKNQSNAELQKLSTAILNFKKLTKEQQGKVNRAVETAYEKLQAKGVSAKKVVTKPATTPKAKTTSTGGLKAIISDLKNQLGASSFKAATTNTNIVKDIKLAAYKKGKRIVRNAGYTTNAYGRFENKVGSTYYENRANRYDANQPSTTRKYKLAKGGEIANKIRFDVDFYDDSNTRKESSIELILRGNSLDNVIKDAIKKAYELKKNYIEFYNRNSFLGSINLAISSDFREGRDFREGKIKLADGGSIGNKVYNEMYGVGSSKYLVNFHDGEKTHKDGSPFFDIRIFKNKIEKNKFVKDLKSKGFVYKYAKGGNFDEIKVGDKFNTSNGSTFYIDQINKQDSSYPYFTIKSKPTDYPEVIHFDEFNRYLKNGFFEKVDGKFAKGGTTSSLSSIRRKYDKNEDENRHSENVVLLATNFGDEDDLKLAKEILRKHNDEGGLSSENGKKRQDLHLKLITKARQEFKKEGIEFAKGGTTKTKFKVGDKVVGQFRYDYGEGLQPVSIYDYADRVKGVISNVRKIDTTTMYSIKFDNGEELQYPDFAIDNFIVKSQYAKGGLTEHGLEVGDEIVMDVKKTTMGKMPTTIGVKDYDKEFHLVDLDKGERYAKGGKTDEDLYIDQLAGMSGASAATIKLWAIQENNLSKDDLLNIIQGLGRNQINRFHFLNAVLGDETRTSEIVSYAKSNSGFKMADGGDTSNTKNKKIMEEYRVEVSDLRNQSYPRMSPSLAFKKASEYMLFNYSKEELAEAIKSDKQIEMFGMEKTWLNALNKAKKPSKMANGGRAKRIKRMGC